MLGERDRRQSNVAGSFTRTLHGSVARVPRPLTVHVVIGRQGHSRSQVSRRTPTTVVQRTLIGTSARLLPNRRQGRQAQWRVWILGTTA
jgi:hypothetical protein